MKQSDGARTLTLQVEFRSNPCMLQEARRKGYLMDEHVDNTDYAQGGYLSGVSNFLISRDIRTMETQLNSLVSAQGLRMVAEYVVPS